MKYLKNIIKKYIEKEVENYLKSAEFIESVMRKSKKLLFSEDFTEMVKSRIESGAYVDMREAINALLENIESRVFSDENISRVVEKINKLQLNK